jgi:Fic family protein
VSKNHKNIDTKYMPWKPEQPYNELSPLPPKVDIETKEVLKACIRSRTALAEVKQAANLLPNPSILINIIPLLEAQASSEIENTVTTTDRLFQFADQQARADSVTKEVLRCRTALRHGFQSLQARPLCTTTAVEVGRIIKGAELDVRKTPGTQLVNDATNRVVYTPPEGSDRLRSLLQNLDDFIHANDRLDPLIKMAVMHYQFEAIHPFIDSNGRTGRILILLYLVEAGLLELPVLYLSGYIIRHKAEYYKLLLEVTKDGRWEEWICYMQAAVEQMALWTVHLIGEMRRLMREVAAALKAQRPQFYSRELVEILFVRPYCRIANLVEAKIARRQTASRYLHELVELGLVRELHSGREKLFVNDALLRLLTDGNLLSQRDR